MQDSSQRQLYRTTGTISSKYNKIHDFVPKSSVQTHKADKYYDCKNDSQVSGRVTPNINNSAVVHSPELKLKVGETKMVRFLESDKVKSADEKAFFQIKKEQDLICDQCKQFSEQGKTQHHDRELEQQDARRDSAYSSVKNKNRKKNVKDKTYSHDTAKTAQLLHPNAIVSNLTPDNTTGREKANMNAKDRYLPLEDPATRTSKMKYNVDIIIENSSSSSAVEEEHVNAGLKETKEGTATLRPNLYARNSLSLPERHLPLTPQAINDEMEHVQMVAARELAGDGWETLRIQIQQILELYEVVGDLIMCVDRTKTAMGDLIVMTSGHFTDEFPNQEKLRIANEDQNELWENYKLKLQMIQNEIQDYRGKLQGTEKIMDEYTRRTQQYQQATYSLLNYMRSTEINFQHMMSHRFKHNESRLKFRSTAEKLQQQIPSLTVSNKIFMAEQMKKIHTSMEDFCWESAQVQRISRQLLEGLPKLGSDCHHGATQALTEDKMYEADDSSSPNYDFIDVDADQKSVAWSPCTTLIFERESSGSTSASTLVQQSSSEEQMALQCGKIPTPPSVPLRPRTPSDQSISYIPLSSASSVDVHIRSKRRSLNDTRPELEQPNL